MIPLIKNPVKAGLVMLAPLILAASVGLFVACKGDTVPAPPIETALAQCERVRTSWVDDTRGIQCWLYYIWQELEGIREALERKP